MYTGEPLVLNEEVLQAATKRAQSAVMEERLHCRSSNNPILPSWGGVPDPDLGQQRAPTEMALYSLNF
jgi:hypothetical protein